MVKNILTTGASGLLGRALFKRFCTSPDYHVTGTYFKRPTPKLIKLDLTDFEETNDLLAKIKPDLVIHCSAERDPDICEAHPDKARSINVTANETLVKILNPKEAGIIFISTDYIFDGKNPPYRETDKPNPVNEYARCKLESEQIILSGLKKSYVLRLPILFGEVSSLKESAVTKLALHLNEKTPVSLDHSAQRYPTNTEDIAEAILQMSALFFKSLLLSGIFHFSSNIPFTKYEMLRVMARSVDLPFDHIMPDTNPNPTAPRPKDCRLNCDKIFSLGIKVQSKFEETIGDIIRPFFKLAFNLR